MRFIARPMSVRRWLTVDDYPNGRNRSRPDPRIKRRAHICRKSCLSRYRLKHDVRHSYATAGRDAKIDWKALSKRIGHADVAFTMKQCVQTDLESDRQVANTLAELIIGGSLASAVLGETA